MYFVFFVLLSFGWGSGASEFLVFILIIHMVALIDHKIIIQFFFFWFALAAHQRSDFDTVKRRHRRRKKKKQPRRSWSINKRIKNNQFHAFQLSHTIHNVCNSMMMEQLAFVFDFIREILYVWHFCARARIYFSPKFGKRGGVSVRIASPTCTTTYLNCAEIVRFFFCFVFRLTPFKLERKDWISL